MKTLFSGLQQHFWVSWVWLGPDVRRDYDRRDDRAYPPVVQPPVAESVRAVAVTIQ